MTYEEYKEYEAVNGYDFYLFVMEMLGVDYRTIEDEKLMEMLRSDYETNF